MESISHAFGEALRFACDRNKRGFQTKVGNLTSIDKANFCHILKGAGASEEKRRAILAVVLDLDPTFPARTYDEFLSLGQWLLDHDNDPMGWQPLSKSQEIDMKVLAQSIEIIEELINDNKNAVNISASKKTTMITAMYENIKAEIDLKKQGKKPSIVNSLKLFFVSGL
jgi:hypothetical protein